MYPTLKGHESRAWVYVGTGGGEGLFAPSVSVSTLSQLQGPGGGDLRIVRGFFVVRYQGGGGDLSCVQNVANVCRGQNQEVMNQLLATI